MLEPRSATGAGGAAPRSPRRPSSSAPVELALALAVAAQVEARPPRCPGAAQPRARSRRGSPCTSPRRAGSTTPPSGSAGRQEQGVGEAVEHARSRRRLDVDACARRAMMRRRWPPRNSSRTSIRWAAASTSAARLRGRRLRRDRAGARVRHAGLRRRRGRPARPRAGRSSRRSRRARERRRGRCSRPRRSRARRCYRVFAEEGLGCDVAVGRRARARAARPASTRSGSSCTATRSRDAELRAGRRGRRRAHRDRQRSTTSSGSSAVAPAGARQRVLLRDHARRQPPTRTRRSRPASPTRSSASTSRTRRRRSSASRPPTRLELARPALPHRLPAPRPRPVPRGARGARGARRASASTTSAAGSASPTRADDRPPSIEDYVRAKVDARATSLSARQAHARSSRAARSSRTPA